MVARDAGIMDQPVQFRALLVERGLPKTGFLLSWYKTAQPLIPKTPET